MNKAGPWNVSFSWAFKTNIDIRNERIAKHVFQDGAANGVLSGTIDMQEVEALEPGETTIIDLE